MANEPEPEAGRSGAVWTRLLPSRLSAKLILLGTTMTIVAVASAFLALTVEVRRQSRARLTDLLRENQTTIGNLQTRELDELLWTSRLMTESPTLRAAMETYRSESSLGGAGRSDLLATIRVEVDRIRQLVGKDLAMVADEQGRVLAVSHELPTLLAAGYAPQSFPLSEALPRPPDGQPSQLVISIGSENFQVGSLPIVLQGYVIGTLTLGDRIDAKFLAQLREWLRCDVALVLHDTILGTTLPGDAEAMQEAILQAARGDDRGSAEPTRLGDQEYVVAALSLGHDEQGRPATLILLHSLSRALGPANRSLLLATLVCGALGVVLAGGLAWTVSRSVLDPLERFVAFMRSVAVHGDHAKRFQDRIDTAEIGTLNEAYVHLMKSLQEREQQLLLHAREDLMRVERLKESEKLASLGRMLAGAAHEINNPLTGVMGNLELLLQSEGADEGMRSRLQSARQEARRIVMLVRNLLKLAHRDTGEKTQVDLNQLLKETAALRQHDYTKNGLFLRVEPAPAPVRMLANDLELQQVFLNIINNAFDALQERPFQGKERGLVIRVQQRGDLAVVTLADDGPGIKDARRIFDHFYTTKPVGKGTGLGLSISHAAVTNYGGTIVAENRREGGACFTVTLPLAPTGSAAARRPEPAPPPQTTTPDPQPPSAEILLVEDEAAIREMQMAVLKSLGARPVETVSGEEAVHWLESGEPDLIISDIIMPGLVSGKDLFYWVQRHRPAWAERFVFVTGDMANEETRAFLERTQCPVLTKPFTLDEYAEVIREALQRFRPAA